LQRIAAVPGVLTDSKPVYLPDSLPRGLDPGYLFVRSGCLREYDLSGAS